MAQRVNIWQAASNGDLATVKELIIQGGASPDARDSEMYTPLAAAASWNHPELVRWLVLEAGATIDLCDDDGESPLFLTEDLEMAQLLIELGADHCLRNNAGLTAEEVHEEQGCEEVADYLRTLSGNPIPDRTNTEGAKGGSDRFVMDRNGDLVSEHPNMSAMSYAKANDLYSKVQELVDQPNRSGFDKIETLRKIVTESVLETFSAGQAQSDALQDESSRKKGRSDDPDR